MDLLQLMTVFAFMVIAGAQPQCDPLTQYNHGGMCCKLCPPGTSMLSTSACLEPLCQPCEQGDYQDKYTMNPKCERQPYCDANRNFEVPKVFDTTKRHVCKCKDGFHCSDKECITCVRHSPCGLGFGVKIKADHLQDTVCEVCAEGLYSDESSVDGVCKIWTDCAPGQGIQQIGTNVSDTICETPRTHVAVIASVIPVILVLLVVAFLLWFCTASRKQGEGKLKDCFESCRNSKGERLQDVKVPITHPTEAEEEDSMLPEMQSTQEEGPLRTPEENDDNTAAAALTDKGNVVTQENGKSEQLSRQESQTQTTTDSFETSVSF